MSSHKCFCALTVSMMVGVSCCVPTYAQHRMSLQTLFDLADQQSQRIKVSEAALKAAEEGVASAKSALLPSVEFSVQGSYTGNAFLMSRGFSTSGSISFRGWALNRCRMANSPHHIGVTALQPRRVRSSMLVVPSTQALKWQGWGVSWQNLM